MKIGDLIVTKDRTKIGIILEGARDWFNRRGEDFEGEPNLFYIYWVNVDSGKRSKKWHKENEPVVIDATVYEG